MEVTKADPSLALRMTVKDRIAAMILFERISKVGS